MKHQLLLHLCADPVGNESDTLQTDPKRRYQKSDMYFIYTQYAVSFSIMQYACILFYIKKTFIVSLSTSLVIFLCKPPNDLSITEKYIIFYLFPDPNKLYVYQVFYIKYPNI